jgi:hypothetical protein
MGQLSPKEPATLSFLPRYSTTLEILSLVLKIENKMAFQKLLIFLIVFVICEAKMMEAESSNNSPMRSGRLNHQ